LISNIDQSEPVNAWKPIFNRSLVEEKAH